MKKIALLCFAFMLIATSAMGARIKPSEDSNSETSNSKELYSSSKKREAVGKIDTHVLLDGSPVRLEEYRRNQERRKKDDDSTNINKITAE